MGCTSAIVFACFGAAYGTAKAGVGISAMGVLRPDLIVKSTYTIFPITKSSVPCDPEIQVGYHTNGTMKGNESSIKTDEVTRHCSRHHGWYHWHLRTGRVRLDLLGSEAGSRPLYRLHSARRWSVRRPRWSCCWVRALNSRPLYSSRSKARSPLRRLIHRVMFPLYKHELIRFYRFAIGIVGDAGVRGTAQQPRLFVGMILILIFAEVLGLYGLIVALLMNSKATQDVHC